MSSVALNAMKRWLHGDMGWRMPWSDSNEVVPYQMLSFAVESVKRGSLTLETI
jgi:hypothetical protein